ncbi:unnamed protein product [marine sediment metagenome]|uniref:Uncharacterized protein n=1 Tax=marine sediment metagenome TaxID=412755 RepID=X1D1D4_9ZZZZ
MIPEMPEHLKPERKYHNINAKRLYDLIKNRLLTLIGIGCSLTSEFAIKTILVNFFGHFAGSI